MTCIHFLSSSFILWLLDLQSPYKSTSNDCLLHIIVVMSLMNFVQYMYCVSKLRIFFIMHSVGIFSGCIVTCYHEIKVHSQKRSSFWFWFTTMKLARLYLIECRHAFITWNGSFKLNSGFIALYTIKKFCVTL